MEALLGSFTVQQPRSWVLHHVSLAATTCAAAPSCAAHLTATTRLAQLAGLTCQMTHHPCLCCCCSCRALAASRAWQSQSARCHSMAVPALKMWSMSPRALSQVRMEHWSERCKCSTSSSMQQPLPKRWQYASSCRSSNSRVMHVRMWSQHRSCWYVACHAAVALYPHTWSG
jgi:hypothetical protein